MLWWSAGALLVCEEHLDITIGFSLKTDNEGCLLCWFWQPTVITFIIVGFETKTDRDGLCHANTQQVGYLPSPPFSKKNIKKFPSL